MSNVQSPVSRGTYLLAIVYGGWFLVMLWAAYTGNLRVGPLKQIPYMDKWGHVILYCIASYLGHRALRLRHMMFGKGAIRRWRLPTFPVIFGLFTLTEEIFQGFVPNRTLDAIDLVCSFVGVALGYWLAERHRRRPSTPNSTR